MSGTVIRCFHVELGIETVWGKDRRGRDVKKILWVWTMDVMDGRMFCTRTGVDGTDGDRS